MEIPAAQGYLDWSQAALKEGEPLDPSETPFLKYPYWNLTPPPVRWKREVLLSVDKSWNHALQNLPDRLDLVLGLSRVDQALGRFEDQYALLAQTLQKNDRNDDICKWIPGKEAPAPPKILLANALMEAEAYYFSFRSRPSGQGGPAGPAGHDLRRPDTKLQRPGSLVSISRQFPVCLEVPVCSHLNGMKPIVWSWAIWAVSWRVWGRKKRLGFISRGSWR